MTEPRIRDLLTWVDAHRAVLVEHSGALAEAALWIRGGSVLDAERAATRCERVAFELATALEALLRVSPPDPAADEDTAPIHVGACGWCAADGKGCECSSRVEPTPYREPRDRRERKVPRR